MSKVINTAIRGKDDSSMSPKIFIDRNALEEAGRVFANQNGHEYPGESADAYVEGFRAAIEQSQKPAGKYDEVLKPFLALMERELHANTGKGDRPGWLKMSTDKALLEIYYHLAKLQKAVKNNEINLIAEHSADVANMAMMLLDVCGGIEIGHWIGNPEPSSTLGGNNS